MKKIAAILLLTMMILPAGGWAASPWTEETTYKEKTVGKLEFGVKNLLTGWTEIFTEPKDAWDASKDWGEFGKGIMRGLYHATVFTVGGILHLATFPVTQVDVPLPHNGVSFE